MNDVCRVEGDLLIFQNEIVCDLRVTPNKYLVKYIKKRPEQYWDTLYNLAVKYRTSPGNALQRTPN